MKTLLLVLVCGASLAGCVIAPLEPAPVVYTAPAVVVSPPHHHARAHRHHRHRHWR